MKRLSSLLLLFMAALLCTGAGDAEHRFQKLGHQMVCGCGCTQILLECNHVGCPSSPGMIDDLHKQVASGGSDTSIFNFFAAKYGPTVLASPIRGGFDNAAFIVPAVLGVLAIFGTIYLIKLWGRRNQPAVAGAPAALTADNEDDLRARIRRETEY